MELGRTWFYYELRSRALASILVSPEHPSRLVSLNQLDPDSLSLQNGRKIAIDPRVNTVVISDHCYRNQFVIFQSRVLAFQIPINLEEIRMAH